MLVDPKAAPPLAIEVPDIVGALPKVLPVTDEFEYCVVLVTTVAPTLFTPPPIVAVPPVEPFADWNEPPLPPTCAAVTALPVLMLDAEPETVPTKPVAPMPITAPPPSFPLFPLFPPAKAGALIAKAAAIATAKRLRFMFLIPRLVMHGVRRARLLLLSG